MFSRPFCLDRLLDELAGTAPFAEFCRARGIGDPSLVQPNGGCLRHRWRHAISALPAEGQARIKLDLGAVAELVDEDGTQALLATADGRRFPPEEIDAGAVLALWFLVREPAIFKDVFLRYEVRQEHYWRDALGPRGIDFDDVDAVAQKLADGLAFYFREREGIGRFAAAEAVEDGESIVFHVWVGDRARSVVTIADDGHAAPQRVQSAKRRVVKLVTPANDRPDAIEELLHFHSSCGLEALSICYAELTVRMRVDGQSKNYSIQLWPERSNLGQTPFGERLQRCLQRWNLTRTE